MTPNAEDRAAIAREVLTELAKAICGTTRVTSINAAANWIDAYRDEHYPTHPPRERARFVSPGESLQVRWDADDTVRVSVLDKALWVHRSMLREIAALDARVDADGYERELPETDFGNRESLTPPPIPLGAVVEVEGDGHSPYTRAPGCWRDAGGVLWYDAAMSGQFLTALYHARRERDAEYAVRRHVLNALSGQGLPRELPVAGHGVITDAHALYERAVKTEHERDAARRELAEAWAQCCAVQQMLDAERAKVSDPAPLSGAGNTGETGKAPRRAQVAFERNTGYPHFVIPADADASAYDGYPMASIVPVIEARVTREMVERVAEAIFEQRNNPLVLAHWTTQARAALSALGLTVEE